MTTLTMNQQTKGVRTSLLLAVLLSASCVPYVEAVFGIPDFLEYGTCANVTLMENFDPVKFTGMWFDIASVPNEYQQTKECISQKYSWRDDHISVVSRGLSATGQKIRVALAFFPDEERQPQDPAQMKVIAEGTPESPYQVIATDYRTSACVYSCLEYFGFRAEFFWVYGRTPTLPESTISRCHRSLAAMGVDYTKMSNIRQDETCPYYKKLDQLLENNNKLMQKTLGPVETFTTPETTNPPTTTIPTTIRPPTTTTPTTTNPPTTTLVTTRPPTTTIPTTTTPTTTNPPTTIPASTQPLITTPTTTNPPTTTTSATTRPPTITTTTSSPSSEAANVPSPIATSTPAARPRPNFTLTSGRAAHGILPEEDMDVQKGQEEKITASRQQTVFSNTKEVTPSGRAWRQKQQVTQSSTAGMSSGVGSVALLMPLLGMLAAALTLMILR